MHADGLPYTRISQLRLVLIVQAIFLVECRQTDRQTDRQTNRQMPTDHLSHTLANAGAGNNHLHHVRLSTAAADCECHQLLVHAVLTHFQAT